MPKNKAPAGNITPITRADLHDVDDLYERSEYNAILQKADIVPVEWKKRVEDINAKNPPVEQSTIGILFKEAVQNPKIIMSAYRAGADIKGFVTAGPSEDEDYPDFCEIHCLYIDPTDFRKGIGTALFSHAADAMAGQGFKDMFIMTLAKDDRANSFYKKMGGKRDGQIKPYSKYDMVLNRYLWEL